MTNAQIAKIKKDIRLSIKTVKTSPKKALNLLVDSGMYDKNGKLRKAYR
jgi:hypothetical protein